MAPARGAYRLGGSLALPYFAGEPFRRFSMNNRKSQIDDPEHPRELKFAVRFVWRI